jgi:hypothetical protein
MNSCLSQLNGGMSLSCADLEMQVLRLFFEMDATGVAAAVAVLRAAGETASASGPRRALLLLAVDGEGSSDEWALAYQEARLGRRGGGRGCMHRCCRCHAGQWTGLDAWEAWRGRLADLLVSGFDLPAPARAALHLRQGLIFLLRDGDAESAGRAAAAGLALVDAGQSQPLALALGALAGFTDCLAGHLVRADVRLSDAAFLCHCAASGALPRALALSTLGLVKLLLGDAEAASRVLDRLRHDAVPGSLPECLLLLVEGHRLYAATALGHGAHSTGSG